MAKLSIGPRINLAECDAWKMQVRNLSPGINGNGMEPDDADALCGSSRGQIWCDAVYFLTQDFDCSATKSVKSFRPLFIAA